MRTLFIGIMLSLAVVSAVGCASPMDAGEEIVDVELAKGAKNDLASAPVDFTLTTRRPSKQLRVKLEAGIYVFGALIEGAPNVEVSLERVEGNRRTPVAGKIITAAVGDDGEHVVRTGAAVAKGTYLVTVKLKAGATMSVGSVGVGGFGQVLTKPAALANANFVANLDLGPWSASDLESSEIKTFHNVADIVLASQGLEVVKPGTFATVTKSDVLAAIASGVGQDGKPLTAAIRSGLSDIVSGAKATAFLRGETSTGKFYLVLSEFDINTSVVTVFALGTAAAAN